MAGMAGGRMIGLMFNTAFGLPASQITAEKTIVKQMMSVENGSLT